MGVQVGDGSTQINYYYSERTWADRTVAPLVSASGAVDSPYRGLSAFEERDAPFFFGRETVAMRVLERMSQQLDDSGLLMVSGASGAGSRRCCERECYRGFAAGVWRRHLGRSSGRASCPRPAARRWMSWLCGWRRWRVRMGRLFGVG